MKTPLVLFLLGTLSACAGAPSKNVNRPGWVDGDTSGTYPSAKYVTAVGNGASRESAVQSAKSALASSFLQKVEGQVSTESKSELKETTAAQSSGEAVSKSRSGVQISTNIQLRGAEVVQFWQDPDSKEHYALAVLDKLKVRNSYLLDLNRMKDRLQSQFQNFQNKPAQKTGRELLELSEAYGDLAREAAAVGTPLPAIAPLSEGELQAVRAKMQDLKRSQSIALELKASGEADEREAEDLKALLANCLQEKGYSVAEGGGSPLVKFSGTYRVSSKHLKMEGFSKFEFAVKASLAQGGHSEKIFAPKETSGRDRGQAFDGVKGELAEAVCSAITQAL